MAKHYIKLSYGNYETIINKLVDVINYKDKFLKIFNMIKEKHPDDYLYYTFHEQTMYIYADIECLELGWIYNTVATDTVELCRLSMIKINEQFDLSVLD
jgi:hypothetical protein